jgi:hypothetical protein
MVEFESPGPFLPVTLVNVLDEAYHEGNACAGDSNNRYVPQNCIAHRHTPILLTQSPSHLAEIIAWQQHKVNVIRESLLPPTSC